MLRRLGIRAKVMAVLAVPMIVLLAAGGFISWNAIQELRYAKAADSVITTLQAYTPVSSSLQAERLLSLNGAPAEEVAEARAATDAALDAVRPITAKLDLSQFPKSVVDRFVEVQLAHNTMLPAVRTSVDIKAQRAQIENNYSAIIEGQLSLMEQVANSLENRDLAQYVTAYREVGTTADNLVVELIDGIQLLGTRAPAPAAVRAYDTQTAATELARARTHAAMDALGVESLQMPTKDPTSNFTRMRAPLQQGNPDGFAQIDVRRVRGGDPAAAGQPRRAQHRGAGRGPQRRRRRRRPTPRPGPSSPSASSSRPSWPPSSSPSSSPEGSSSRCVA